MTACCGSRCSKGWQDVSRAAGKAATTTALASIRVPRANILQLLPEAGCAVEGEACRLLDACRRSALHFLGGRPLKLVRHIHGTTFYHKGPLAADPALRSISFASRNERAAQGFGFGSTTPPIAGACRDRRGRTASWARTVDDIENARRADLRSRSGEACRGRSSRKTPCGCGNFLGGGLQDIAKAPGGKGVHLMSLCLRR